MNITEGGNEDNWVAELHDDDDLFRQPDGTHPGECPICFLPMPLGQKKSSFYSCCSRSICKGCIYANYISNKHDVTKAWSCPFCRTLAAASVEENKKRMMKRIKANDPVAMSEMAMTLFNEGDYDSAIKYWTMAAELGDPEAHFRLGYLYSMGEHVKRDKEKKVYHYEKAAIGGHLPARYNLGCHEHNNDNMDRAAKHFIIAAKLGDEISMKGLWTYYSAGNITKEDLEATLRNHKAAMDETKSAQRDAGEVALKGLGQKGFRI